jgi:hypothetical protein
MPFRLKATGCSLRRPPFSFFFRVMPFSSPYAIAGMIQRLADITPEATRHATEEPVFAIISSMRAPYHAATIFFAAATPPYRYRAAPLLHATPSHSHAAFAAIRRRQFEYAATLADTPFSPPTYNTYRFAVLVFPHLSPTPLPSSVYAITTFALELSLCFSGAAILLKHVAIAAMLSAIQPRRYYISVESAA